MMLFVIDVGNTNTVLGLYDGPRLVTSWRLRTERNTTEDEFNILVSNLFAGNQIKPQQVTQTAISCVVPPMVTILDAFCRRYLRQAPLWVDARSYQKMPILIRNPEELGADRIVNSVAAFHKYQQSLVVIDFGTATTFDVVSDQGAYMGGIISPGIMIASEALFLNASKLPRVEIFEPPAEVVGQDTAASLKSGIIYGYAGLVDGIVQRIKDTLPHPPKIIATGGLAPLMAEVAHSIEAVEPWLTLEGLRIISNAG